MPSEDIKSVELGRTLGAGFSCPSSALDLPSNMSIAKHIQKDHRPNWQTDDVMALIVAKQLLFVEE